jgi:hypothetical protein
MYLFTLAFWNYSFERMVKTVAQVAVAALTATTFIPTEGDAWETIGLTSAIAALVSVLTSLTAYSASEKTLVPIENDVNLALDIMKRVNQGEITVEQAHSIAPKSLAAALGTGQVRVPSASDGLMPPLPTTATSSAA